MDWGGGVVIVMIDVAFRAVNFSRKYHFSKI